MREGGRANRRQRAHAAFEFWTLRSANFETLETSKSLFTFMSQLCDARLVCVRVCSPVTCGVAEHV